MNFKKICYFLIDIIAFWLIIVFKFVLYFFPFNWNIRVSYILGTIWYYIFPIRKEVVRRQLKQVFSELQEKEIEKLALAVFRHLSRIVIEFLTYKKSYPELEKTLEIIGWENYERVKKRKVPVIAITIHIGNWDFLSYVVAKRGVKLVVISRRFRLSILNRIWMRGRKSMGIEIIEEGKGIRDIIKMVKGKDVIGVVIDQRPLANEASLVEVPLLGRTTLASIFPSLLCKRLKTVFLPVYCINEGGKYKIVIEKEIRLDTQDHKTVMAELNKIVTNWILKYPEQWLWLHRRWKV